MKLSLKPSAKSGAKSSSKSKVVVSSKKKKQPKNKFKIVWLSSLALLLFLSVGYTGFGYVQTKQLKAKAGSTEVLVNNYVRVFACKQTVPSAYGNLYKINVTVFRRTSETVLFEIKAQNGWPAPSENKVLISNWDYGFTATRTVYAGARAGAIMLEARSLNIFNGQTRVLTQGGSDFKYIGSC